MDSEILLRIIGSLIVCVIFGMITKYINNIKGYEGGFAWGFWLNLIGVIVVACKPDNRANAQKKAEDTSPYDMPVADSYIHDRIETANNMFAGNDYNSALKAYKSILQYYSYAMDDAAIDGINQKMQLCCEKLGLDYDKEKVTIEKKTEKPNDPVQKPQEEASGNQQINLIKELAELKAQGIISEEEFEAKKKELLAKI